MRKPSSSIGRLFTSILACALVSCGKIPTGPTSINQMLFEDSFTGYQDGLITNEYAFWNPSRADSKHSLKWELTSGSLFAVSGEGWTGVPDNIGPNALSSNGTNSAIFRLTTKQRDFGDVSFSFDLLNQSLTETTTTPRSLLDGVHILLRYQNEENLYYASVNRRDNTSVIKKKVPGGISNNGTYYELSKYVGHNVYYGGWQSVTSTVKNNTDGSVSIELYLGGQVIVRATDDGSLGGPSIRNSGKIGIRGDNADLKFKNFKVRVF